MDWGERTIVDDQQSVDGLRAADLRHEPPAHQQQHLLQQPLQQPLLQPVQQLHTYMPQSTTPSQLPPPHHSPLSLAIPISDALRHRTAEADSIGCVEVLATVCSIVLMVLTLPISLFLCFKVVQEYERAVIFRLGRLRSGGARGPGVFFVLPCIDNYCKVDLRTVSFDVPPQEVLTRDSVTVSVDAVVYYRIRDPLNAVVQVANYSHSTRLLAATTLRNVLGTRNLSELLTEREAISHSMQVTLDEATDPWGVQVERVEIKDVSLPDSLQRSMAAEAEAAREARAKVIAAEGEMKSSRALKEASDIMCESPAALQLRYLQTLSSIAGEKNSTIVFPLPIELIGPLMNFTSSLGVQRTTAPVRPMAPPAAPPSTTTSTSSPLGDPSQQQSFE
ncbi:band 7 protein AGAP004871-like isoform X1 [Anopheles arabiensis]|uniref:AGAP003352-PB n=5 Tax=gambiae species complex TaxID=44542 RepID=F5HLR5_ANOGA|nr:band 7 protein AGAP004871-like isoform X1 [Anopheles gambiae]XP_040175231.1 band 7 protein AGAP004871-like isoform X1 [Anopheles arabiensis]XP_040221259.1 band 7 protein AGAP004871-like isoform X1 [Anopheles coluzzii]XP_041761410.1 band 7 protein AGAP004871-like isoform X1 [Anopheles merus]EGK97226.1 AGAP003352-PB [Anopheles gambiae str. PEST]